MSDVLSRARAIALALQDDERPDAEATLCDVVRALRSGDSAGADEALLVVSRFPAMRAALLELGVMGVLADALSTGNNRVLVAALEQLLKHAACVREWRERCRGDEVLGRILRSPDFSTVLAAIRAVVAIARDPEHDPVSMADVYMLVFAHMDARFPLNVQTTAAALVLRFLRRPNKREVVLPAWVVRRLLERARNVQDASMFLRALNCAMTYEPNYRTFARFGGVDVVREAIPRGGETSRCALRSVAWIGRHDPSAMDSETLFRIVSMLSGEEAFCAVTALCPHMGRPDVSACARSDDAHLVSVLKIVGDGSDDAVNMCAFLVFLAHDAPDVQRRLVQHGAVETLSHLLKSHPKDRVVWALDALMEAGADRFKDTAALECVVRMAASCVSAVRIVAAVAAASESIHRALVEMGAVHTCIRVSYTTDNRSAIDAATRALHHLSGGWFPNTPDAYAGRTGDQRRLADERWTEPLGPRDVRLVPRDRDGRKRTRSTVVMVHRAVMAARSPYFRAIMSGAWSERDLFNVDAASDALDVLVRYAYDGFTDEIERTLRADTDLAIRTIRAADFYAFKGLVFQIERVLIESAPPMLDSVSDVDAPHLQMWWSHETLR